MNHSNKKKQFYDLTPDKVLHGVDQAGFLTTGEYFQLNSYENRVFDIHLEPDDNPKELRNRLITKFYRPERWSLDAIMDEHNFLNELRQEGIPAVAPIKQKNGKTVSSSEGIFMALFPKIWGRLPQELNQEQFKKIGRTLARIHNIGEQKIAENRPSLTVREYGWPALDILHDRVAVEVWNRYEDAAVAILEHLEEVLDESQYLRIHGDCHKGNLLLTDFKDLPQDFLFVDFDDFCNGPPAQDFWMLFSGDSEESRFEQEWILSGYEELRSFDDRQLDLMLPLRGLRIIHYAAWIARRWDDPSFPNLFPQFQDYSYWAQETESLEKIAWSL
ncbi:MAG: serine/threonine protein kinase [Bdellovibrionales bacterium]|nr:serine/threonine protein kinase [Bdellovibrionales bacterium]